jgi:methionyl-tRNA synthetase
MVLTDIIKRWQVLKGRKALLLTGTDEHGLKVRSSGNTQIACADSDPGSKSICKGRR